MEVTITSDSIAGKVYDRDLKFKFKERFNVQDFGILPPGIKHISKPVHDYTGINNYIIKEIPPQYHRILYRSEMKHVLEYGGNTASDEDYYDLAFPWVQIHIIYPFPFDDLKFYQLNCHLTMTNKEMSSLDDKIIDFHMPNTMPEDGELCIYGDALGISEGHSTYGSDFKKFSIGELVINVTNAIFQSGWNINVGDWPSSVPEELSGAFQRYLDSGGSPEDFLFDETEEANAMRQEVLEDWKQKTIIDMLNLPSSNKSIADKVLDKYRKPRSAPEALFQRIMD